MTRIPASQAKCPNCGNQLPKIPVQNQECPTCKKLLYVKIGADNIKYAVTEDEITAIKHEIRQINIDNSTTFSRNNYKNKPHSVNIRTFAKNKRDFPLMGILGLMIVIIAFAGCCAFLDSRCDANTNTTQFRGVQERTEENVDEWQYDGRRSPDGIDWEFIDRAREAFETGK